MRCFKPWVFALLSLIPGCGWGDTAWEISSKNVSRVYDGDTIYINLPGLPPVFGKDLGIRLRGVDTPELRSRCTTDVAREREKELARLVRDIVRDKVDRADVIRIDNISRGSFFRVVAEVYLDGDSLNKWILTKGYAYIVVDGKMQPGYWCDPDNY